MTCHYMMMTEETVHDTIMTVTNDDTKQRVHERTMTLNNHYMK